MRRNVLLLSILFGSAISIFAEPYKPKPIIWVHGYRASSASWGAPTRNRSDSIPADSVLAHPEATYSHFLNYMTKYSWVWYNWEKEHGLSPTYTPDPYDTSLENYIRVRFPNKTFLEVVNMDDNVGSVDYDPDGYRSPTYNSWAEELYYRVKEVLKEYYGDNWETNLDAKVILIAHSMGNILNCKMKNERI